MAAAYRSMPRFPLTPAEEARVPRPHSSQSQVATVAPLHPSRYSRYGGRRSSAPSFSFNTPLTSPSTSSLQRPPRTRHHQQQSSINKSDANHPYGKYDNDTNTLHHNQQQQRQQQGDSHAFPFSLSTSSVSTRQLPSTEPTSPTASSPTSPLSPSYNSFYWSHSNNHHNNNNNNNNSNNNNNNYHNNSESPSTAKDEVEYPQNPQDTYPSNFYSPRSTRASSSASSFTSPYNTSRRSLTLSPLSTAGLTSPSLLFPGHGQYGGSSHQRHSSLPLSMEGEMGAAMSSGGALGSPLELPSLAIHTHHNSWGAMGKNAFSSIESPTPLTDSDSSGDSDVEGDGHKEGSKYTKAEQMAFERLGYRPRPSQSRGALGRMGGSTSTFRSGVEGPGSTTSFHDNNRTSFDSEPMTPTTSRFMGMDDSSAALPAHQRSRGRTSLDMSDDERRQQQQQQQATEPKKNRASWRPSLSLIRQESSSFNVPTTKQDQKTYPQNDPYRLSDTAMLEEEESKEGATTDAKPTVTDSATGATPTAGRKIKSDEKKKRRRKRRRSERKQQVAAVQAHASRGLPDLADILEKRTRYPLSFDDFEAFLRSHRAVEYLNFWADVTAHEQLCKTFAISERRLKREQQLEERAMARDRRGTYGHLLSPGQTASTGVLEGGSGRRSMERNQLSIYDASNEQESPNHSIRGGSMDVFANLKVPGRRPSASTVEYLGNGIRRATPQQPPARQSPPQFYQRPLSPPSIFGEKAELEETEEEQFMQPISGPCDGKAELDETVEELLSPPMAERFDKAYGEPSTAPWSQVSHRKSVVPNGSSMASVDSHRYDYGQQLRRDESNVNIGGRRSGESAYSPSLYSPTATATGSGAQEGGRALLAQSYRMISLEDVEESAMKIYRKYLIQLRTASMAAEEREADAMALRAAAKAAAIENGEAAFSGDDHTTMSMRGSGGRGSGRDHERVLARGWDGYAEQVIAEWNERWKENRSAETRRARRMAHRHRRGLDGVFEQPESVRHQQLWERGASSTVPTSSRIPPEADLEKGTLPVDEGDRDAALAQVMDRMTGSNDQTSDGKNATGRPRRPKMDRNITSTGITAFLARLLKTETTVVELPNMTINTTTVVTHADRSDGESEYDDDDDDDYYDDDYDSEDLEDQDEDGVVAKSGRSDGLNDTFKLEAPIMSYLRTTRPNSADASLAGDMNVFESNGPSIQLHRMVTMNNEGGQTRGMPLTRPPYLQEPSAGSSNPADDATLIRAIAASDEKRSDTPALEHVQSIADLSTIAAQSAEAAAFYLPLECRQRIHTQMQQQQQREQDTLGRLTLRNSNSDGSPQMFGGAKTFVVDVVLRDHYFPLFLQQVKDQNLGLLHQNHINNRIKQRGILVMGLLLWTLVLAGQVVLMLMGMGGWRKPWVWVVGLVGGFLGCLCLWTGQTGFSPLLGLLGKMSEDQRVFRLRPIKEYSIRSRHWRQAVWIVVGCLFWSGVAAAIFAILPQDI